MLRQSDAAAMLSVFKAQRAGCYGQNSLGFKGFAQIILSPTRFVSGQPLYVS